MRGNFLRLKANLEVIKFSFDRGLGLSYQWVAIDWIDLGLQLLYGSYGAKLEYYSSVTCLQQVGQFTSERECEDGTQGDPKP
jgi:hypothetical protein